MLLFCSISADVRKLTKRSDALQIAEQKSNFNFWQFVSGEHCQIEGKYICAMALLDITITDQRNDS